MSDYISREELDIALDSLCDRVCAYSKKQRWVMCGSCPLGSAFDVVEELPAADVVERKRGEWNFTWHSMFKEYLPTCSCCGRLSAFKYNFCPECGADMRQDPLAEKPCDNCSQDKCTIAETGSCEEARMVTDGQDEA